MCLVFRPRRECRPPATATEHIDPLLQPAIAARSTVQNAKAPVHGAARVL